MTLAHATSELLTAFASGSLSDGLRLLVASHLPFCPGCRARVARLEAIGGALLLDGEIAPPSPDCLARALARIEAETRPPVAPTPIAVSPLPAPLRARLGRDLDAVRWRMLLPGVSEHRLDGFEGEDVRLLRARPGARIPQHTHIGVEGTLVLAGRMRDGDRVLTRGDLAFADADDDHRPRIEGAEACVCLVVLTGPMRFTGPLGRALNLLT